MRVVILTGAGRAFCVGGDIAMFVEAVDPAYQRQQSDTAKLRLEKMGRRLMDEWEQLDQVTIAAINGFAVGGGFSLATACDFRLAAAGTRMWVSEVTLGMPFMWGANTRLINLVGMGKAKEIVMTGEEITAEEALTIGLVNQVVPLDQLQEVTLAFADKLLSKPPMALRRTKEFFAALSTNRAGDITYADAHLGLATFASEDMQEAVAAFREKRQGKFHNR
jgi:enoyl-CoA hydratase/carnithine racemase